MRDERARLHARAVRLEWITIAWNVTESAMTIGLGLLAASLALVGFGADSLVEVFASSVVVWHLAPGDGMQRPERTRAALRLVAAAFLTLAVTLTVVGIRDLATGRRPDESPWGIAYLAAAVVVMFTLAALKHRLADRLDSAPLRAEATMSFLDGILASATLLGLALNLAFGWWWADPAAALMVAAVAGNEARENWEEAAELGARPGDDRP